MSPGVSNLNAPTVPGRSLPWLNVGLTVAACVLAACAAEANSVAACQFLNTEGLTAPWAGERMSEPVPGIRWRLSHEGVTRSEGDDVRVSRPAEAALSGIYFVTADEGWVVGEEGTVLHTADGGRRWTRQVVPVDLDLDSIGCSRFC
jgi:photosystem II stability/assembly factor-like uncharacterized protein